MEPDTRYTVIGAVVLALVAACHLRLPLAQQQRPRLGLPLLHRLLRAPVARRAAGRRQRQHARRHRRPGRAVFDRARQHQPRQGADPRGARDAGAREHQGLGQPQRAHRHRAHQARHARRARAGAGQGGRGRALPGDPRGHLGHRPDHRFGLAPGRVGRHRAAQGQRADGARQPAGVRRAAGQPARPVRRPEQAPGAARQDGLGPGPGHCHDAAVGRPDRAFGPAPGRQRRAGGQGRPAARCARRRPRCAS